MKENKLQTVVENNRVILRRFFDSPRELVFEAWSAPEHLAAWWGPDGFTLTTHSMDFSTGGIWTFTMHGPDGRDFKNRVQFIEIKKPELIRYKHSGEDDTENIKFQTLVLFKEVRGGTNLEISMEFPTKEELEWVDVNFGAIKGAEQHIERLGKFLELLKKEKGQ